MVSIVIACKNAENTIVSTLKSFENQSYSNIEIIIVDDGSSDKSIEIIEDYIKNSKIEITLEKLENSKGAANARNIGMKLAKGHYICFNDADDISRKRRIEFQVKALQNNNNKVFSECLFLRKYKNNHLKVDGKKYMLCIISMLFERQKVLGDLGGMANITLGEDSEFRERMIAFYGSDSEKIIYYPLYEASFSENSSFFSRVKDLKIKGSSVTYEISEESNIELENYRKNWHNRIRSKDIPANISSKPKF